MAPTPIPIGNVLNPTHLDGGVFTGIPGTRGGAVHPGGH